MEWLTVWFLTMKSSLSLTKRTNQVAMHLLYSNKGREEKRKVLDTWKQVSGGCTLGTPLELGKNLKAAKCRASLLQPCGYHSSKWKLSWFQWHCLGGLVTVLVFVCTTTSLPVLHFLPSAIRQWQLCAVSNDPEGPVMWATICIELLLLLLWWCLR